MICRRLYVAAVAAGILLTGAATATATPSHQAGTESAVTTQAVSRFDNGSFETPRVPQNSFSKRDAGQFIGPWKVTSGSVDHIGAGYWQAAEGDQSLDLNGTTVGAVAQTFTTLPGAMYTVTYSLAGNPTGPVPKTGKVLIDGQNFQDFSFDITGKTSTDMGYITRTFTFTATSTSTTLTFTSTTSGSPQGPVIDNVTVQSCPPCPCN